MSTFVVAVFPTEAKANDGTRAMRDLQAEGSLMLYGMAVVTKAADGKLAVKETVEKGPLGTAVGLLTGGLVGLLGGPSAAATGVAGGALIGSWSDLFDLVVGRDFLDKVSRELTPGKTAVVADVEEDRAAALDAQMEAIGGTVLRQGRSNFEHEQIQQVASASRAELAELQAEYRQATEDRKAEMSARIDEALARMRSGAAQAKENRDRLRQETEAKIKALEEQRARAQADDKAKYEQRIAKLRADYDRSADDLTQAAELWLDAATFTP
jgi:uncharacterized membrane protein